MSEALLDPEAARLHHLPPDVRPWQREFIIEALDGVIVQATGAVRFLERADDDRYAKQAVVRAVEFLKCAVGAMNDLAAENRRMEAQTAQVTEEKTP